MRLEHLAAVVAAPAASLEHAFRTVVLATTFLVLCLGVRCLAVRELLQGLRREGPEELRSLYALAMALPMAGFLGMGPERVWSLGLLLLWLPLAVVARRWLARRSLAHGLARAGLGALLVFPASFDYLRHYARSPVERLPAADYELGRRLADLSAPTDPFLHRPNRGSLSLASHVSFRPSILCYYGRAGRFDEQELEARSRDVRLFFATTDANSARAVAKKYGVELVLVERHRPLQFDATWLDWVADGENLVAYAVH